MSALVFLGVGQLSNGLADAGHTAFAENGLGRAALHGLAGGVLADLRGGNFGHGFLTAGVGKLISSNVQIEAPLADMAFAMLIGGTISELSGDTFANGAVMAGLQWAFNESQAKTRRFGLAVVFDQDKQIQHASGGAISTDGQFTDSIGHAFVYWEDSSGQMRSAGFWPDGYATKLEFLSGKIIAGAVMSPDPDHSVLRERGFLPNQDGHWTGNFSRVRWFDVSASAVDSGMEMTLNKYAGAKYSLDFRHCGTFAVDAAMSVGVELPYSLWGPSSSRAPTKIEDFIRDGK